MTSEQKTAVARIVSDIIKADNILDISEIELYEDFMNNYKISNENIRAANKVDFAQAINILQELPKSEIRTFIKDMERLTVVDGDCDIKEALLIIALNLCLDPDSRKYCKLISTDVTDISIGMGNVIYTETESDGNFNETIEANLRYISNDFKIAGLEFVYIPQLAKDFTEMKPAYLMNVVKFLAPALDESKQVEISNKLRNITTKSFTEDFLMRRMGLDEMYDSEPSLLFQICKSNNRYIYMHMTLGCNVLDDLVAFVDRFNVLTYSSQPLIKHTKTSERFIYSGFHRSMFDIIAFPGKKVESIIVIDDRRGTINFADLDIDLQVPTKQKAMYMFLIHQSIFSRSHEIKVDGLSDAQKKKLEATFQKFYGKLSSSSKNSEFTNNLSSNLSKLRKAIRNIDLLDNVDSYLPERTEYGTIRLTIKPSKVFIKEGDKEIKNKYNLVPILESERWRDI